MAVTGRALHVAPDTILRGRLGGRATTLNIVGSPDVRGDLTRLPFPAGTFELIVCSHVLEHIPDDAAALAEMRRALAPGGVLLLIVPGDFDTDATYEDWSIVSPEGRHDAFGQWDHVRVYGRDARARVERQPWSVDEIGDGLEATERLYICRA